MKQIKSNRIKMSTGYKVFTILNSVGLTLLALSTLYPLIHVIMASISNGNALTSHSGLLWRPVGGIDFTAYTRVFSNPSILTGYRNTLFLLVVGIGIQVFVTAMGAYVLSRKYFPLKNFIMMFITFTMVFQGGMIPFYLLVKNLGLMNNLFALIIPFTVSAFNMIIMRTSFASVPESLEESAKLDGASHWKTFTAIMLPLNKPVLAVMVLYYGVSIWNGWFWASLFMQDPKLYPLQLVLRGILVSNSDANMTQGAASGDVVGLSETIKYATIVVSTMPLLIFYPFVQKYFVSGVMIGAVKE